MLGQLRSAKPTNHCFEVRWRNSKVICWTPCATERLFDCRECIAVFISPAHILEQRQEMLKRAFVIDSARSLNAVRRTLVQARQTPLWEGNANDRDVKDPTFHHRIECREDHLMGQISRHAKDYQGIRLRLGHHAPSF